MRNEDYEKMFNLALTQEGKLLKGYSNFHRYSFGNQLWAMCQMWERGIEISPIATFKKWQELGRQVQRGSKALALFMPITVEDEKTGKDKVIFIARNKWFALSQTEGDDVVFPEVGFDYEKALQELNIVKVAFEHTDGNCQGFARKGQIAINPIAELPSKTFFHEVAHNLLHLEGDEEFVDNKTTEHNIKEVEAEGVALFVSLALGLAENVPFAVGYVKNWLGKGNEIPIDSIKRIFRAADKILKAGQEKEVKGSGE
jgi:antirestriction protein ArdC